MCQYFAKLRKRPKVLPWDERKGCDVQSPQWSEYFVTKIEILLQLCAWTSPVFLDETKTEQEVYLKE